MCTPTHTRQHAHAHTHKSERAWDKSELDGAVALLLADKSGSVCAYLYSCYPSIETHTHTPFKCRAPPTPLSLALDIFPLCSHNKSKRRRKRSMETFIFSILFSLRQDIFTSFFAPLPIFSCPMYISRLVGSHNKTRIV